MIELQPAHAGEAVAVRVEEHVLEQRPGGLLGGGIARAHLLVDLLQGLVPVPDLVVHQPFPDRPVGVLEGEDGKGLDLPLPDRSERILGDLPPALEEDLPGLRIRHVRDDDFLQEVVQRDGDGPEGDPLEPLHPLLADLGPLLEGDFIRPGMPDLHRHLQAGHQLGSEILGIPVPLDGHLLDLVEGAEKLLRAHPDRPEQDRDGELPLPVDLHEEHVLVVELEVEPGAAVRDDPGREEHLAGGVGLSLVMLEEHPGGAVQLAHDDPLGPVDDEGRAVRHEGDLPEEDLLLLDVPDGPRIRPLVHVEDDELHRHLDRGGVVHPPFAALVLAPFGLADGVGDELEGGSPVVVVNREDPLEDRLQPAVLPLGRRDVDLQKIVVGLLLRLDQVRYLDHLADFRKVDPLHAVAIIQIRHLLTPGHSAIVEGRRTPAVPRPGSSTGPMPT